MDLNVLALTGNLTQDPEIRSTPSGAKVAVLRVANSVRRKQGDTWGDKTSFFDVEVWGGAAENAARWLSKGSRVGVRGELEIDTWEDRASGQPRSKPVIRQATVSFEDRGSGSGREVGRSGPDASGESPVVAADPGEDVPF